MGLAAVAFSGLRGASRIILIGAPDDRLALGREMGADTLLNLETTSPEERAAAVHDLTGGRGVDVALEASGNAAAVPEALSLLRDGGTYVIAGHYTDAGAVEVNPHVDINRKHARILGQWGTDFDHVVRALGLLVRHRERLPFHKIVGQRYTLEEANRALEDVAALKVTKALITPG